MANNVKQRRSNEYHPRINACSARSTNSESSRDHRVSSRFCLHQWKSVPVSSTSRTTIWQATTYYNDQQRPIVYRSTVQLTLTSCCRSDRRAPTTKSTTPSHVSSYVSRITHSRRAEIRNDQEQSKSEGDKETLENRNTEART